MKSLGNVATVMRRPENGGRDITTPATGYDVKTEDKLRHTNPSNSPASSRLGGSSKSGKASMPTNPGKASLEITNAIRRRQETTCDLDYWDTLPTGPPQPPPQPLTQSQPSSQQPTHHQHQHHPHHHNPSHPKPLYRAVLRGSLYGDNATTLCTLSSIMDAVNDREYNMTIRKHNNNNNGVGGHVVTNGYHFTGSGSLMMSHSNTNNNNNNKQWSSVVRAEENQMGLTINGLGISDMVTMKTQKTHQGGGTDSILSTNVSPRVNGWKGYSSAGFVKQRRQADQQSSNNNNNNNDNDDKTAAVFNNPDDKHVCIGVVDQTPPKSGHKNDNSTKTPTSNNLQPPANTNAKMSPRSPRLYLTTRQQQNNVDNNLPDTKRFPFSPRSDPSVNRRDSNNNNNINNTYTSHDSPRQVTHRNKNGGLLLVRQSSLPVSSSNDQKQSLTSSSDAANGNHNNNASFSKTQYFPANNETTIAKRKFSNEVDKNCRKLNKQDSLPNPSSSSSSSSSATSSSCIQFADSIISALTVDLNKMYSICQTKVRYAEFIEQSQPHRLDDANSQQMTSLARNESGLDDHNPKLKLKLPPKDFKSVGFLINNHSNSNNNAIYNQSHSKNNNSKDHSSPIAIYSSPQQSQLSTKQNNNFSSGSILIKNSAPIRLAPLSAKTNKFTSVREITSPELETKTTIFKSADTLDKDSPRGKATRPILKSSKTDIETVNLPSFRPAGDKTDSNNNTSIGSNSNSSRLVRFKINHEVREFAPSEPVRYY